jgi:hypothetical protein
MRISRVDQLPVPVSEGSVTFTCELLRATTKEELRLLAAAWTDRVTKGQWLTQHGYSPESVRHTKEGYEMYVEANRD